MLKNIFGDTFDFNRDGQMDKCEKRAEYTAFLDEVRAQEGIQTPVADMDASQLAELATKSGIDPNGFGF